MKIKDALAIGANLLKKNKKCSFPFLRAEIILSYILGISREKLLALENKNITLKQERKFKKLIAQHLKGVPIHYLTKEREFFGFSFYVNKNVLIPRPESEKIIEEALLWIKYIPKKRLCIADIGTGSGNLGLTLAKILQKKKQINLCLSDVSKKAIEVAKINAKRLSINRVKFIKANLLNNLPKNLDIILANLPYLNQKEIKGSLKFEPKKSLYGGKEKLEKIKKFLSQSKEYINRGTTIFLECP